MDVFRRQGDVTTRKQFPGPSGGESTGRSPVDFSPSGSVILTFDVFLLSDLTPVEQNNDVLITWGTITLMWCYCNAQRWKPFRCVSQHSWMISHEAKEAPSLLLSCKTLPDYVLTNCRICHLTHKITSTGCAWDRMRLSFWTEWCHQHIKLIGLMTCFWYCAKDPLKFSLRWIHCEFVANLLTDVL